MHVKTCGCRKFLNLGLSEYMGVTEKLCSTNLCFAAYELIPLRSSTSVVCFPLIVRTQRRLSRRFWNCERFFINSMVKSKESQFKFAPLALSNPHSDSDREILSWWMEWSQSQLTYMICTWTELDSGGWCAWKIQTSTDMSNCCYTFHHYAIQYPNPDNPKCHNHYYWF